MKIKVDEVEIMNLPKWKQDVIKNDLLAETFDEDMKRRLCYVWEHKFEQCYKRMQDEWLPKLQDDPAVQSIPADKEAFVQMVMARPDYKNRSAREAEAKSK